MLNKFANFRFTNVHKGIALLYGLGACRAHTLYGIPQDSEGYRYVDHAFFVIIVGFMYVCPPFCIFMWNKELKNN